MSKKIVNLIVFVCLITLIRAEMMDLYLLDSEKYPEQMCLDGSTSGFYFQKGHGNGESKWIIFFQGGGACLGPDRKTALLACSPRLKMGQGSSNYWEEQKITNGIYSDDYQNNPYFYNWNKVFIPYCDGLVHQGYNPKVVRYLTFSFRFRGLFNTQGIFQELIENFGLADDNVTEVLLTGSSAGALAVLTYADYLADILHETTKFWAMSDSGLFINYFDTNDQNFMVKNFETMLTFIDKDYILPQGCDLINTPGEDWKCVMPVNMAKQMKSDLFIIESEYDEFTLIVFDGIFCIKHASLQYCSDDEQEMIQNFRLKMKQQIYEVLYAKDNANAWSIGCVKHGFTADTSYYTSGIYQVPMNSGYTPQKALYEWMYMDENSRYNYIDDRFWPYNTPCNGVEQQLIQE